METNGGARRTDGENAARFIAGSSALLMASLLSGVLSFLWTVLMSRLLGPKGYGLAGPFMTAFWMLSIVFSVGVPQAMATFISDRHHENPAEAKLVMAQGTRLLFTLGVIFASIAGVGVAAAAAFLKISHVFILLSWIMLVALLGRQVYMGMFAVMGGVQKLGVLAVSNGSYSVSLLSCSLIFVLAVRHFYPGDTDKYLLAGAGGVAAASVIQYGVSLVAVKFAGVSLSEIFAWRGAGGGARKLLLFGLPAAISAMACAFFTYIPPVIVSSFAYNFHWFGATPSENAVRAGWFSGGFTYAFAPMLIVGMVFAIVPAVSEADSQGNHPLMQKYFNLAVKYCLTVMFYVLCVYSVFAGHIVQLFSGNKFPGSVMGPLTVAMSAGMSLCMLFLLMCNLLTGLKRPKVPAVVAIITLAVECAALTVSGALQHSIFAAAIAFNVSVFLGFLYLAYYLNTTIKLRWAWSAMPRPIIAGAATALLVRLLPADGAKFLIGVVASLPCYFGILVLIGGIKKEEFEMLRGKKK